MKFKIYYIAGCLGMTFMALTQEISLNLAEWQVEAPHQTVSNVSDVIWPDGGASQIAIRFQHPDYDSSRIARKIPLEPDTDYEISARLKLDCPYLEARGYAGLTLSVLGADGTVLGGTQPQTMRSDWKTAGSFFHSGANREASLVWSISDARGDAWIGQIEVRKVEDPKLLGDVTPPDLEKCTRQDASEKYTVFKINPLDRPFPTRGPRDGEKLDVLEFRAAANETEGASFGVFAWEPLRQVSVELTEALTGPDGNRLAPELVDIRVVTPEKFALDALRYWELPVFLYPNQATDVAAERHIRFFVNVKVPAGTPAGAYHGALRIASADAEAGEVPLVVNVYPFALPEAEVPFFMYHNLGFDDAVLQDMAEHGMNSFTAYDDATEVDGKLQSMLPYMMEQARKNKLLTKDIPVLYLYTRQQDWLATFCPPLALAGRLLQEREERQWPELLFYCVDEPNSEEAAEEAKNAIRQMKQRYPQCKMVSAVGKGAIRYGLAEFYDVLILDVMDMDRELQQMVRSHPDKQWLFYECRQNGKTPVVDRYGCGFFNIAMGGGGFAQWIYSDVNRAADSGTGIVYGHVLLTEAGPVPTLGWEAKREGIDDYRYTRLLERMLEKTADLPSAKVQQIRHEAQALLQSIRERIRPESYRERLTLQDGVSFRLDNTAQPELDLNQFDCWRQQIAAKIIQLQETGD